MARIKQTCGCVFATRKNEPVDAFVYCDRHRPSNVIQPRRMIPDPPDPSARIAELEGALEKITRNAEAYSNNRDSAAPPSRDYPIEALWAWQAAAEIARAALKK